MKTLKVFEILDKAGLTRHGQTEYYSELMIFQVKMKDIFTVLYVRVIKKVEGKDIISDVDHSVIIKTLKELKAVVRFLNEDDSKGIDRKTK